MSYDVDREVRPYFGEHAEPVGYRLLPVQKPAVAMTPEQRWENKISDGVCPRTGCGTDLDPEGACERCGWSVVEYRMQQRLANPALRDDYVPQLSTLFRDEFAPADLG